MFGGLRSGAEDQERCLRCLCVGPKELNKNPLPLDKQSRTDSILCYTHLLPYDPHMSCLLLKALPHPSQAARYTLIGNRLITI